MLVAIGALARLSRSGRTPFSGRPRADADTKRLMHVGASPREEGYLVKGAGFLAIWSDVKAEQETDYLHWLTREHAANA